MPDDSVTDIAAYYRAGLALVQTGEEYAKWSAEVISTRRQLDDLLHESWQKFARPKPRA